MDIIAATTSMGRFAAKAHHCPEMSRLFVRLEESAQYLRQFPELFEVGHGEGVDPFVAERRERQPGEAVVVGIPATFEEAEVLGPVDEADGTVVANQERPGDVGDGRAPGIIVAPYGQQ